MKTPFSILQYSVYRNYLLYVVLYVWLLFSGCASSHNIFQMEQQSQTASINPYYNAMQLLENNGFSKIAVTKPIIHYSAESFGNALLPAIMNAKKSIFIIMFLANENEYTKEIFKALIKKAEEGVEVYFLFDGTSYQRIFDNPSWNDQIVAPSSIFRRTKVHWAEFNPLRVERVIALPQLLIRDHRKIVMIDGIHIFTGGYNINIYSFAPIDKNGNVDAMIEFWSPEAGRFLARDFVNVWNKWSAMQITSAMITPADQQLMMYSDSKSVEAWLGDQDLDLSKGSPIRTLYQVFFQEAQSEVWLIQALAVITKSQMKMIQDAIKRGVMVNLMLSEDQFSSSLDKAAKYMVLPLLNAGVSVYIYKSEGNALLHYKLIMADKNLVGLGSPNFNLRSMYLSQELALVFKDDTMLQVITKNLEDLMTHARKITKEEASQWRGLTYFMNYLVSIPGG